MCDEVLYIVSVLLRLSVSTARSIVSLPSNPLPALALFYKYMNHLAYYYTCMNSE